MENQTKNAPAATGAKIENVSLSKRKTLMESSDCSALRQPETEHFSGDHKTLPEGPVTELDHVKEGLIARVWSLLHELRGEPNRDSGRTHWRFGRKGALAVSIEPPHIWFDHSEGQDGDLIDLIRAECGLTFPQALAWAAEFIARTEPDTDVERRIADLERAEEEKREKIERARFLFDQSGPISGTPAERYLNSRRFTDLGRWTELRFHPALKNGETGAHGPGMLALMRDPLTLAPSGIQRTFLSRDGVKLRRAMLGSAGVCTLIEPPDLVIPPAPLAIAEGLEDAMALAQAGEGRVWACLSAGALARFPVLPCVSELRLYPDADRVGIDAAREVAARYDAEGVPTIIRRPRAKDWAAALGHDAQEVAA
jgi:hypothetical protein